MAVTAAPSGQIIVGSWIAGTVAIGGGTLTSTDAFDILLSAFDPNGAHAWSRRIGGPGNQFVNDLALGPSSDLHIIGSFSCQADFGGGTLTTDADSLDIFLAKYGP